MAEMDTTKLAKGSTVLASTAPQRLAEQKRQIEQLRTQMARNCPLQLRDIVEGRARR